MDFNQDLGGLVWTGQEIARQKRRAGLDINKFIIHELAQKTAPNWDERFAQRYSRLASMPEVYSLFKHIYLNECSEFGVNEDVRKKKANIKLIQNAVAGSRIIVTCTTIEAATKMNALCIVFDYYGASPGQATYRHTIQHPGFDKLSLEETLGSTQGLQYLQNLFLTEDNRETIRDTLGYVTGLDQSKTIIKTGPPVTAGQAEARIASISFPAPNYAAIGGQTVLGAIGYAIEVMP